MATAAAARAIAPRSLDYQHAFDLCAALSYSAGGRVTIYASSPYFHGEMAHRLPEAAVVAIPASSVRMSDDLDIPYRHLQAPAAAVWACPHRGSGARVAGEIARALASGATLSVVVPTFLARFLPEWETRALGEERGTVGVRQVAGWLRGAGFAVRSIHGFHGPSSILWGYAGRLAELLGRPDLADRLCLQMRRSYAVSGISAHLAPVAVVVAARTGGKAC